MSSRGGYGNLMRLYTANYFIIFNANVIKTGAWGLSLRKWNYREHLSMFVWTCTWLWMECYFSENIQVLSVLLVARSPQVGHIVPNGILCSRLSTRVVLVSSLILGHHMEVDPPHNLFKTTLKTLRLLEHLPVFHTGCECNVFYYPSHLFRVEERGSYVLLVITLWLLNSCERIMNSLQYTGDPIPAIHEAVIFWG